MTHAYTIHPSAAHLIPSQLSPPTREPVPVALLHETPRFRYFSLGADAVIRASVDNVYWFARDGWAELATGLIDERSTVELAARILFKDPGATCEEVTEPARTTQELTLSPHVSPPLNDEEVLSLTVWETREEIEPFRAGWCWHRDNRDVEIPEYGPHEWTQNERVAWQRGVMAAKAAHDACGGTVEERAEMSAALKELEGELVGSEIRARFPAANVKTEQRGSDVCATLMIGGACFSIREWFETGEYALLRPGDGDWIRYGKLSEALDAIARATREAS